MFSKRFMSKVPGSEDAAAICGYKILWSNIMISKSNSKIKRIWFNYKVFWSNITLFNIKIENIVIEVKKSNITILNNEVEKNYLITKYCDSIYNNNTIHPYILSFYTIFVRFHASIIRWCVNDCNSENAPSANNLVVDSLLERNHVLKFNKWQFFPIK